MVEAETPAPRLPLGKLPENVDAEAVAQAFIDRLPSLGPEDVHDDAAWRDIISLTNTYRTFHSRHGVHAAWTHLVPNQQAGSFKLKPESATARQVGPTALLSARFTFETKGALTTKSTGLFILTPVDGADTWTVWPMLTLVKTAEELGDVDALEKAPLLKDSATNGSSDIDGMTDAVVVGAGQSGLFTLSRFKALGVTAIGLEKNAAVGDNWTNRYDSATLHLSKWYANMPFGDTFNDDKYPYFLTADHLARGYRQFAEEYGLEARTSSNMWTVNVDHKQETYSIKTRHVVFAIGADQVPNYPQYPNRETYKGITIHSVDYKSPKAWKGLKGAAVGTANTAHDVAEDMVEEGLASVTMVQRSPTIVLPWGFVSHNHNNDYNALADLYESDQMAWGLPLTFSDTLGVAAYQGYAARNADYYEALEAKGFRTVRKGNIMKEIRQRSGGHYLDVGNVKNITDGLVQIKGGEIESYTPTGLKFKDGSTLDADVIVWATGFQSNIRNTVGKIVGPKANALLEDYPRWNEVGEVPGWFRPQKQYGIWYATGDLAMGRLYSRFMAYLIKAGLLGIQLEPYSETP
ncbi:putative flavin-containing monooxygenase [Aspergillus karnatakaensis]|uniref:flavin-containing monooxygenase n=1 Tax=Aspergillus karnatakaensis TaxID=1810916 RepID=UPI003CCC9581